jgi:hypothetical protein
MQRQKKGFKTKEQSIPKAALVWRTGLSGVPPDSVRCTTGQCPVHQGIQLQTCQSREFGRPLRYNSPDCPVCQRSNGYFAPTIICEGIKCATVRACARRSQSRRQKAHRTIRWPHKSELQQSNPNGWVTWLAHQTVSGGAPDCPVRSSTEAIPNGHFGC